MSDAQQWSYLPRAHAPVFVLGLTLAGFTVTEQQVSNQTAEAVARALAPDDAAQQEAVGGFLALLSIQVCGPRRSSLSRQRWLRGSLCNCKGTGIR